MNKYKSLVIGLSIAVLSIPASSQADSPPPITMNGTENPPETCTISLLSSGLFNQSGLFQFTVSGSGTGYRIFSTPDCLNWTQIGYVAVNAQSHTVTTWDPSSGNIGYRFYSGQAISAPLGCALSRPMGFIKVTIPSGGKQVAFGCQLISASTVASLFPGDASGIIVYKKTAGGWDVNVYDLQDDGSYGWTNPNMAFNYGDTFYLKNYRATPVTMTLIGRFQIGSLSVPLAAGVNMVTSPIPQPGKVDVDLGFQPVNGDKVHRFDTAAQSIIVSQYSNGSWTGGTSPTVGVGEAFWIETGTARNWTRTYMNPAESDPY
jgi:hypothetical protein